MTQEEVTLRDKTLAKCLVLALNMDCILTDDVCIYLILDVSQIESVNEKNRLNFL